MTSASSDPAVRLQHFATRLIRIARSTHKAYSLSSAQFSAMALLNANPSMTVVELARREQVSHPTMSRLIAGLARLSLVSRTTNLADKRGALLSLTPQGETAYREVAERRIVLFRILLAQLKPETIAEILAVVESSAIPLEALLRNE
jgi:DNA-binding MarR family transcriptional regulator